MFRFKLVDIDTVVPDLDLLFENVDAIVIRRRDRPGSLVEINLDKTGARRVTADITAELVNKRVVDEHRFEIIGRVKDPVGVAGRPRISWFSP